MPAVLAVLRNDAFLGIALAIFLGALCTSLRMRRVPSRFRELAREGYINAYAPARPRKARRKPAAYKAS